MDIKLNAEELKLLVSLDLIPKGLLNRNKKTATSKDGSLVINFSDAESDRIRNKCGDQLQKLGFDEHYELTNEGRILESLIDKFLVQ